VTSLTGGYDATNPIKISRFTIHDDHGKKRWMSTPEIVIYSSNIGAAKMALDVGAKNQQAYLSKLGLLTKSPVELPEVGTPLKPSPWRDINVMTIGYGHGLAVTPVHMAAGVSTIVNGGIYYKPTVIKREAGEPLMGERVFKTETSAKMRQIMRQVVTSGTGGKSDLTEYRVGGKTGTAEKLSARGGYQKKALVSSFIAAFPIDEPRYVVSIMVDEPRGTKKTYGFATGGWVAAPAVGRTIRRLGALLGIQPENVPQETAPKGNQPKPAATKSPLLVNAAHRPASPEEPPLVAR
jgi:cell division protein FtsI (penicillin-binding protein 3)